MHISHCQFSKNLEEIEQFDTKRKIKIPKAIEKQTSKQQQKPAFVCPLKNSYTGSTASPHLPG